MDYPFLFILIYVLLAIILILISLKGRKTCNIYGSILDVFHRFIVAFIYLAPIVPYSFIIPSLIFLIMMTLSWKLLKGKCMLTCLTKEYCGEDYTFKSPVSKLSPKVQSILMICIITILVIRLFLKF